MKKKRIPPEYGLLTYVIAGFFRFLQKTSLSQLFITNRVDSFADSGFSKLTPSEQKKAAIRRVVRIDNYILTCVALEIACVAIIGFGFSQNGFVKYPILTFVILRLIDIVQVNINLSLFDVIRTGKALNYMASFVRTIINVIVNYFEIILCFGVIYTFKQQCLTDAKGWTDAFYYSAVTQITLGFGQIMPQGIIKFVTILQFLLGFFFTALIIGRFISLLPPPKENV